MPYCQARMTNFFALLIMQACSQLQIPGRSLEEHLQISTRERKGSPSSYDALRSQNNDWRRWVLSDAIKSRERYVSAPKMVLSSRYGV